MAPATAATTPTILGSATAALNNNDCNSRCSRDGETIRNNQDGSSLAANSSALPNLEDDQIDRYADFFVYRLRDRVITEIRAVGGNPAKIPQDLKIYLEEFMALEERMRK